MSLSILRQQLEQGCVGVKQGKSRYSVFRNRGGDATVLVKIDAKKGSQTTVVKDDQQKETLDEDIQNALSTFNESRKRKHEVAFRDTWFPNATSAEGMMWISAKRDEESGQWGVKRRKKLRGGRFEEMQDQDEEWIPINNEGGLTLFPERIAIKDCIDGCDDIENHPLYDALMHMAGVKSLPNSTSLMKELDEQAQSIEAFPLAVPQWDDKEYQVKQVNVIKQVQDSLLAIFNAKDVLASAYRAFHLLKLGIDNGTRRIRFPVRGFKDKSDDEDDIPREEDRNAKVFLLLCAVCQGGTTIYPQHGSLDLWMIRKETPQLHLLKMVRFMDRIVGHISSLVHGVSKSWTRSKRASIKRALSYFKGPYKLYTHQLEGLKWCLEQEKSPDHGGFLATELGMGKTVQMLALILCYEEDARGRTLVIAPPGLLRQPWASECTNEKFWGAGETPFKPYIYEPKTKNRLEQVKQHDVIIASYDTLRSDEFLRFIPFNRVILDESTYIKNPQALRSMAARDVHSQYRWCISGTPIENSVKEYCGQLQFSRIAPYHHADWWDECFDSQKHRMFHQTMFKRNFTTIIDGRKIEHPPCYVEMTPEERKLYEEKKSSFVRACLQSKDSASIGGHITRLLQLSRVEGKKKKTIELCNEMLDCAPPEDPLELAHYNGKLDAHVRSHPKRAKKAIRDGRLLPSRNSISIYMDKHKDDTSMDEDKIKMYLAMYDEPDQTYKWTLSEEDGKRKYMRNEKVVISLQSKKRIEEFANALRDEGYTVADLATMKKDDAVSMFQEDSAVRILVVDFERRSAWVESPDCMQHDHCGYRLESCYLQAVHASLFSALAKLEMCNIYQIVTRDCIEQRVQQVVAQKVEMFNEHVEGVSKDVNTVEAIQEILRRSTLPKPSKVFATTCG